jgi:hypothetical protein
MCTSVSACWAIAAVTAVAMPVEAAATLARLRRGSINIVNHTARSSRHIKGYDDG